MSPKDIAEDVDDSNDRKTVDVEKNAKDDDKDNYGGGEVLTMKEKYPRGLLTDDEGNLRFVNLVVRCPCCMFFAILVLSVLISFMLTVTVFRGGNPITEPSGQYDTKDIRSIEYDSLRLATEEIKKRRNVLKAVKKNRKRRTQEGSNSITLWIFESENPEEGLFGSEKSVADMREAMTLFTDHADYEKYCQLDYEAAEREAGPTSGNSTVVLQPECRLPLTALNMYYASYWDSKKAQYAIKQLKIPGNIERFNALGLCYTRPDDCVIPEMYNNTEDKQWAGEIATVIGTVLETCDGKGKETPKLETIQQMSMFAAYLKELFVFKGFVDYFYDKDFSVDNPVARYSRATISWGSPPNITLEEEENDEELDEEEKVEKEQRRNSDALNE